MTQPRLEMRASDFKNPETAARRINILLKQIQQTLDGVSERRLMENITFKTENPPGDTPPIVLPQVDFTVKGLVIVRFGVPNNEYAVAPTGWAWSSRGEGGLQITKIEGLLGFTDYVMNVEVFGG